jgi:hypothetical protein
MPMNLDVSMSLNPSAARSESPEVATQAPEVIDAASQLNCRKMRVSLYKVGSVRKIERTMRPRHSLMNWILTAGLSGVTQAMAASLNQNKAHQRHDPGERKAARSHQFGILSEMIPEI